MHHFRVNTVEAGNWDVFHNGDYSGDVVVNVPVYHPLTGAVDRVRFHDNKEQRDRFSKLIHSAEDLKPDFYEVDIPFDLMKQVVADKLRQDAMERLEEMTSDEVLLIALKKGGLEF